MRVSDLSAAEREAVLSEFRKSSEYHQLYKKTVKLKARGMMSHYKEMVEYISRRESQYLREFCQSYSGNTLSTAEWCKEMEYEDFTTIHKNAFMIIMMADIIDTAVGNIKDVAEKYKDKFTLEGFGDLLHLGDLVKRRLDGQMATRSPKVDKLYADTMDSIENYMFKRIATFRKNMDKLDAQHKRMVARENAKGEQLKA